MKRNILILMLLLVPLVHGATIQGTVYDIGLEPQQDVVIEINTVPNQKIIAKDGTYSLEVPAGSYLIMASLFEGESLIASAEESIEIQDDGVFNLDLILFPNFDEVDELLGEDVEFDLEENFFGLPIAIPVILLIVGLGVLVVILLRKKRSRKENILESDLEKVVRILKDKGKRATQKEIRKELGVSEAKVSLMVADLESQGIVRKIKRGRGNVIILSK